MTQIRIINPIERAFSQVPNSLWMLDISIQAKAIFGFALSCRDGHVLRVAEIEAVLRIGRDARRKAMKELEGVGLLRYVITKGTSGKFTTKELVIDATPLLQAAVGSVVTDAETDLPPEKPSVGKSTPQGTESRPSRGKISGGILNTKYNTGGAPATKARKALAAVRPTDGGRAAKAAKATSSLPHDLGLWDLSEFQKSRLRASCDLFTKDGFTVSASDPAYIALQQALLASEGAMQ